MKENNLKKVQKKDCTVSFTLNLDYDIIVLSNKFIELKKRGKAMTIEELYLWAEENGYKNYDIEVMQNDGSYYSARFAEIVIDDSSILL